MYGMRIKKVDGIAKEVRALRKTALLVYNQDLTLRNVDLNPIFGRERIPAT